MNDVKILPNLVYTFHEILHSGQSVINVCVVYAFRAR